jgi:hypothetical protein
MRQNKGARREAIEWEDYRRIHYIATWWFHSFPREEATLLVPLDKYRFTLSETPYHHLKKERKKIQMNKLKKARRCI